DPAAAMASALRALDAHEAVAVAAVSSLSRTPPWGQTAPPDFLNAVAAVDTTLSPRALLDLCLETERARKRVRVQRWGPRVIDMEILVFGRERIEEGGLQVPHPRMGGRAVVLAPLAEIAPDVEVNGGTAAERLALADKAGIER